jgi:protoheme IX farnesyltransferase
MALLPISLLPTLLGVTGWLYAAGAIVLGLLFLAAGISLLADRARGHARRVFVASILYLPALLGLLVLDKS